MSLNGILGNAASGLLAAQQQLRVTSDNVSNLSTPGYIRKLAEAQSHVSDGRGAGVDIGQLRLATDRFLQAAGLRASSASASAKVSADSLDRAQALLGDPNSASSFLGGLDDVFSAFSKLSIDGSASARTTPINGLAGYLAQGREVANGLTRLSREADDQIATKITEANTLLQRIDALNAEISRASAGGGDATGSQTQQSQLVDQLSQLIDVQVQPGALGGVVVRSSDGLPLAGGGGGPAVLSYDSSGPTGLISVQLPGGPPQPLGSRLTSGSLAGLLKQRNIDLPALGDQLSSLMGGLVASLNAAHNAHSAAPPPSELTGRATALSAAEAFGGFTSGRTAVSVTDAAGVVTRRVAIDWAAKTISVDGGAATAFTPATFAGSLNTALGSFGSASFSADGRLKLTAASGGVAVTDDPTAPTSRAGKSFAGFLGLNDLVTGPSDGATGLKPTDTAGFGGAITLRLSGPDGSRLKDVSITPPAPPGTMADLVSALNSPTTSAGLYGSFALDADGRLAFTPRAGTGASLSVAEDTTARGAGGPSISALFGLGEGARTQRIGAWAVRSDIATDPTHLALAKFDYAAAVGAKAVTSADLSGADALGTAGKTALTFASAGGLPGGSLTVSDYAAKFGASVARRAADAASAQTSADGVAAEAAGRRASVEGVNLDQELVNLTTYQQAYNANARLVSAARDLYDVLLNMV